MRSIAITGRWAEILACSLVACQLASQAVRVEAAPWGWPGGDKSVEPAPAVYGQPPAPQQPAWYQRAAAPLSPSWWKGGDKAPPTPNYEHDPIALSTLSGPPTPAMYVAMAELSAAGGNAAQGRQLYMRALEMDPKSCEAVLGLARLEDREGRLPEATTAYRRAVELEPKNTTVLNDYALCLARQNQYGPSYQLLRRAIDIQPTKALYRNNMAKVLIEMNRLDEAVANMNAVHPAPVAQYNMGVMLVERGRTAEAKRYLGAAAVDPQMQPARTLLAQLNYSETGQRPGGEVSTVRRVPSFTPATPTVQTAMAPQARPQVAYGSPVVHVPQEPWSPATVAQTASVDDSILPTPREGSASPYPVTEAASPLDAPPQVDASALPSTGVADANGPALLPPIVN